VVGILVVMDPVAGRRDVYFGVVWVGRLEGWVGRLEGWVSWRVGLVQGCGLAQPEGERARQNGAAVLQTCGVWIWQAAVLLVDCGVEIASKI
jgi:hypothetical protein